METESDTNTLLGFCAEKMPRHMVPKAVEVLDELPKTTSGKGGLSGTTAARRTLEDCGIKFRLRIVFYLNVWTNDFHRNIWN